MDVVNQQLFHAHVMHRRLLPKVNTFTYTVYYLVLPLPATPIPGKLACFDAKDVGCRDGTDPSLWAKDVLTQYGLESHIENIILITMPSILGYVFNPVSFYFCLGQEKEVRAVIAEVHNTFGERHSYVCVKPDLSRLSERDWLEAEKRFHVSPFLERNGHYKFRFAVKKSALGIWINYYDKESKKQLVTSLTGVLLPLTKSSLRRVFFRNPFVTLKTIGLIHFQALKLILKGILHIKKPPQYPQKISCTGDPNTHS